MAGPSQEILILAHVDHDSAGNRIGRISVGQLTVIVYESLIRPGGVTIDVTTDNDQGPDLLITVNDEDLFRGVPGGDTWILPPPDVKEK